MTPQALPSSSAPATRKQVDRLPGEYARDRVLNSQQSADFLSLSLPHFRRQYRAHKVPPPIRITERKLGWRAGDLIDFVAKRATAQEAVRR